MFEEFILPASFDQDLLSVTFSSINTADNTIMPRFALDNIQLQFLLSPEPVSIFGWGLAAMSACYFYRRKRKAAL